MSYELNIKPKKGFVGIDLKEIWAYKDLFYFLAWRDIKVRYKQAAMGVAWAILVPLTTMIVFSVIFGRIAKMPSDGVPYPIFLYVGLLPWQYFSSVLTQSTSSIVGGGGMISKIYFPRLILPASTAISAFVDFLIASMLLVAMMIYYKIQISLTILLVPFFMLIILMNAVGFGLWFAALNVRYRDIQYAVPFLIQIGMFLTPVVYPSSVAGKYEWLLKLNPMAGVIEAMRPAVLGVGEIPWQGLGISTAMGLIVFITGVMYFKKVERFFADII